MHCSARWAKIGLRFWFVLTAIALVCVVGSAEARRPVAVVYRADAACQSQLAAREVCRYLYVRTGALPALVEHLPDTGDAIVLGTSKDPLVGRLITRHGDATLPTLGSQAYHLRTLRANDRSLTLIVGGDDVGVLYGAYRFAEKLGVRFYLHGDVIPDASLADRHLPEVNETGQPLFELRGIQPFHDFTEGPDWWNVDDYKAYLSQVVKMRMNFIGLHCYPEGGVGPEPTVWIGLPEDCDEHGRASFSYPSRYASTMGGAWGYAPTPTSEFAAGAALLFETDDYGPDVTRGYRPKPTTSAGCNDVFNRTADMFKEAFAHAHRRGIRICVGTETPLMIPKALQQRLRELGKDPADPITVRELYEGIFTRLARAHPLDYYWLWTPEGWTWSGASAEQVDATLRDIQLALEALENVGRPFGFATCGWVLGPPGDRALFDKVLPKHVAASCINRDVGFDPVEPGFALVDGRPQWAIPWLEDDPAMIIPQLWAGRMRRDAADALAYGCNGLIGIHWRTKVLGPTIGALAAAAWDQAGWNPDIGKKVELPQVLTTDVHVGGNTADYSRHAIADTDDDRVYQTCRWNVDAYRVKVPNGTNSVTLQFCEIHYRESGKRVFDVSLEGNRVIESLDVFARVGANVPLDFTFDDIAVDDEELSIEFGKRVEYPFIAGIVITGRAADSNQVTGRRYTRKINCGDGAYQDYEPDLPAANTIPGLRDRPRDLPVGDFYADWARAQFGAEVAQPLAALFARLDGSPPGAGPRAANLPRPADWVRGPGGIKPNRVPWEQERQRYVFVDEMAALRPKVSGAGNLERFDYWLNTFRCLRSIGELGCARGQLDLAMEQIAKETKRDEQRKFAEERALPTRLRMTRLWEEMMTCLLGTVSTPGEMGTIANLEQHVRRNNHFLDKHDEQLTAILEAPLPENAHPSTQYVGPPRIIVPTVRSTVTEGEALDLKVIILAQRGVTGASLHFRTCGDDAHEVFPLRHVRRAVYTATLPPAKGLVVEYYITATLEGDHLIVWPATAPRLGRTLTVSLVGQQG